MRAQQPEAGSWAAAADRRPKWAWTKAPGRRVYRERTLEVEHSFADLASHLSEQQSLLSLRGLDGTVDY